MDFFKLKKHKTNVKQEIIAGTTTFLTMAYIIFLNPGILGETGMDKGALITVTCLAAFTGTMITALWVNAPLAMAPGIGLAVFFAYTLVLGMGVTWNVALGVVFVSGMVFLLLTMTGFREKIIEAIPHHLKLAVGAGIGLFIAFIGLRNLGLIIDNPATLVGLGPLTPTVILGLTGFIIMGALEIKKVKGSILIGIVTITIVGIILGYVELPNGIMSTPPSIAPIAFKLDILGALKISMIGPIFSFMFVDLFDSVGTIVACTSEAEMIDERGKIENVSKILEADAAATVIGSLLGTSTTTTFIESASGIAEGGRTGLTSATTAILFFLAMFFTPVIGIVPAFATAPALIIVGVYMFKNLIDIDLHKIEIAIPAFLTIILMPLTYSISTGITFGFISYAIIEVLSGNVKKVKPTMWIIVALSVVELIF
ncbi:MAG: NCS2 family permease [Psychrilyobacter sp.]|uniref:NCS2 family permease n=1 Tax=Psychrilyobacter sp. TaxID=2586924 RepID=UPI003C73C572